MSVYTNIQAALDTKLYNEAGATDVAWPNTDFTPTQGEVYLEPILLPVSSNLETLNDYHRYVGIYQINVSTPAEFGPAVLNTWLGDLHDAFLSAGSLTAGGDTILIQNIDRGPTQMDTTGGLEYYRSNIDINFLVYT